MADRPFDPFESLEAEDCANAAQLAMHGLLGIYFDLESRAQSFRADQIIATIFARRRARLHSWQLPKSRWWVGLAAALLLLLTFLHPWKLSEHGSSEAFATALDNVLYANPLPELNLVDPTDTAEVARVEAAMADARREMAKWRGIDDGLFMHAWMNLYRNLRAIGRWDEALVEMKAALEFNRVIDEQRRAEGKGGWTYFHSSLTDLGYTYAALGDVDRAFQYHTESLRVASEYFNWSFASAGGAPDKIARARASTFATSLGPRLWPLAELSESQGDLVNAREHLDTAAQYFRDALTAECSAHGLVPEQVIHRSPHIDAGELNESAGDASWRAEGALHQYADGSAPPEITNLAAALGKLADPALPSLIAHARGHLLREARWLRLARRPGLAWDTLQLAQTIPYSQQHDESRLDFNEPMEALRVALARRDFAVALTYADQAELRTGGLAFPGELGLTRAPISILVQTELRFLRGAARVRLDPDDAEAESLIQSSIDKGKVLAGSLSADLKERLNRKLASWHEVLHESSGLGDGVRSK